MKKHKTKLKRNIIFILSIIILFSTIFYFYEENNDYACKNCNVILITIDALRADHLGCYGYSINTSPNIDKFANESIIFTHSFSQSSWTLPSMSSVFSSIYPYLYDDVKIEEYLLLSKSVKTLPEILKENGYLTAGFVDACYMNSYFGFNKGFDIYDDRGCIYTNFWGIKNIENNVFEFLNENKQNKFFLYLHLMEVHSATEKNISEYDKNILYEDEGINILLNKLKELNLEQKTIIIITADHGQEIFDHGNFGHGETLYDEVIHVPLIIKIPFFEHKVISNQVESIDIAPTILGLLNITIPEQFQGKSFIPLIMGYEKENKAVYSKLLTLTSFRTNNFKLIYDTTEGAKELYDLKNDPKEKVNLIKENLSISKELEINLLEWLKSAKEKVSHFENLTGSDKYPLYGLPIVNITDSSLIPVSFNPDIIYEGNQLPNDDFIPFSNLTQKFWESWYSDGFYYKDSLPKNSTYAGIVYIHPHNFTSPRFLAQNVSLGNEAYVIVAEFANIAGYLNSSCGDSDVIVKIKILDHGNGDEKTIYEDIIKESDGWKRVSLVMHAYVGKNITFKIEGYAGGNKEWCGELAAVNKFYIGKVKEDDKILEQKIRERLKDLGYTE